MSDDKPEWVFACTECGATYAESELRYVCPSCARQQQAGGMTRGVLEVSWQPQALAQGWAQAMAASGSREQFRSMLPVDEHAPSLPLTVGRTPLLESPRLRRHLGMPALYIKDDTRNPSASYKDRASALVCLKAAEYHQDTIVAASTGNAATALACIAASLGQRAIILVPRSAPKAKLVQMLCYGAQVIPVNGTYDQAFELSLEATRLFGWYNRNTAFNPFTIEGKKTSALEIVAELGRAPDAVVVPTGDGVIVSGIAKGFRDLVAAGVIDHVPRLLVVQAAGSASIARALRDAPRTSVHPVSDAHTVADSICVAAPRAGLLAAREVRASGGTGVIVQDDDIVAAIAELAREAAVFAEPAGAASLAGLHAARREGLIRDDECVVLMVTGHGLKDVNAASHAIGMPEAIEPDPQALRDRLAGRPASALDRKVMG